MSEYAGDSVEALVERVVNALPRRIVEHDDGEYVRVLSSQLSTTGEDALAALTALAARAQEAERERDRLKRRLIRITNPDILRADSAESALREAREALDDLMAAVDAVCDHDALAAALEPHARSCS